VSFQCDACTDVVKKPKLDRHYGQCRASFTCIDCSATFTCPSQWKGHTSCITEAEKYQKSLYKGSKKGQDSGNHKNTQPEITKIPGANSTPLGSTPRMSPVDSSAVDSEVLVEVRAIVKCIKLLIRVCAGGHVERGATTV